jgi:hypothetical protein
MKSYVTNNLLLNFCEWLAGTPGSIALQESQYMYAIVESVHELVALSSLALWLAVGIGGRWIGFS